MQTILILVPEGVMDSGLAITLDTLKAGAGFMAAKGGPAPPRVLTAARRKTVRTGAGLRLDPDLTFKEVLAGGLTPTWVMLPGAGLSSEAQIAARLGQAEALEMMGLLRAMAARGVAVSASCSSVFFLAQAGLLDGRRATTTWWLARVFRARYPRVILDESRMLLRDGGFLTAGSAFSQLDLALAIVTETMGAAVAQLCTRYMLIDRRGSQARYMLQAPTQHVDPTLVAAERWIDAHMAQPPDVAALASALAMSARTLARKIEAASGVSPVKFIQRRKLMHAVQLIETTTLAIDAVAERIGYQDATALRKLVRRELGTTPGALR